MPQRHRYCNFLKNIPLSELKNIRVDIQRNINDIQQNNTIPTCPDTPGKDDSINVRLSGHISDRIVSQTPHETFNREVVIINEENQIVIDNSNKTEQNERFVSFSRWLSPTKRSSRQQRTSSHSPERSKSLQRNSINNLNEHRRKSQSPNYYKEMYTQNLNRQRKSRNTDLDPNRSQSYYRLENERERSNQSPNSSRERSRSRSPYEEPFTQTSISNSSRERRRSRSPYEDSSKMKYPMPSLEEIPGAEYMVFGVCPDQPYMPYVPEGVPDFMWYFQRRIEEQKAILSRIQENDNKSSQNDDEEKGRDGTITQENEVNEKAIETAVKADEEKSDDKDAEIHQDM